ncbi:MAG: MlaD family protein [Verrucomicrobia bacterium]|jgi:paraquat-inducible protein B|nr:MlaD family protein [Verrucomicrobiota bacterium]
MSKKANPTAIGLFVVLGVTLAVAGVVLFASGTWFKQTQTFIVYFDSSVRGLNAGSAVMVSGVKVGTVKEVLIHFNQQDLDAFMPVILEIDHQLLQSKTDKRYRLDEPEVVRDLVDKGLRARLQAESLVTGLLYVDLSLLSDPPPAVYHQVKPIHEEIPSAPNDIQLLMENLARLDLKGLSDRLDRVLASIETNLGQLQMREISGGLTNLLGSLNQVVDAPHLTNALASLDRTLEETRRLAERLNSKVDPLASGAEQTLAELRLALEDLRGMLAPEAPLKRELAEALTQISLAARSIGDLSDYLSRNPNALLSGRKPQETAP